MIVFEQWHEAVDGSGSSPGDWAAAGGTEQDPITAMHDTTEEVGQEAGLADTYLMDLQEADELGVALDPSDGGRPNLI